MSTKPSDKKTPEPVTVKQIVEAARSYRPHLQLVARVNALDFLVLMGKGPYEGKLDIRIYAEHHDHPIRVTQGDVPVGGVRFSVIHDEPQPAPFHQELIRVTGWSITTNDRPYGIPSECNVDFVGHCGSRFRLSLPHAALRNMLDQGDVSNQDFTLQLIPGRTK